MVANGMVGLMTSEDAGATWRTNPIPPDVNYPDAIVIHPDELEMLESGLTRLADIVARDLGCDFRDKPGAGAAGCALRHSSVRVKP